MFPNMKRNKFLRGGFWLTSDAWFLQVWRWDYGELDREETCTGFRCRRG